MVRASIKCSSMTSIEVDICHRLGPLQMLYSMTLTFIFKVKHFFLCICKKLCSQCMSPADLPRLAWSPPWSSYGVEMMYSGMSCVRSFVCVPVGPSRYVWLCTVNKRLDVEAPIFAYICRLTSYVFLPIFIQIFNVLDIHFKGQRFESSTSKVHKWLSCKWWQIEQTLLLPTNRKLHKAFPYIYIWHWPIVKINVKVMHIYIANFSQMVTDWANIAIANK